MANEREDWCKGCTAAERCKQLQQELEVACKERDVYKRACRADVEHTRREAEQRAERRREDFIGLSILVIWSVVGGFEIAIGCWQASGWAIVAGCLSIVITLVMAAAHIHRGRS